MRCKCLGDAISASSLAKQFWSQLTDRERWELGDQLVLGDFDWRDWLSEPPPRGFLDALDKERMLWEV